jgi:two-component system response regulator MprA
VQRHEQGQGLRRHLLQHQLLRLRRPGGAHLRRALLRRAKPDAAEQGDEPLQISDLRIDPTSRRVWRGQREVELSKTEFDLLELLVRNQGIVLEHSVIYDRIWGYDYGPDSKNLAVYISYLRRKLEGPGDSKLIHTVRGVGYTVRAA